jgi:hypothetical protein
MFIELADWQKEFKYKKRIYIIESSFRGRFISVFYKTTNNQVVGTLENNILNKYYEQ